MLFIIFFSLSHQLFAQGEIKIISRSEWGANENLRYWDSEEVQEIVKKRNEAAKNTPKVELTQEQKDEIQKKAQKNKRRNEILVEDFSDDTTIIESVTTENGNALSWPIQKTRTVKSIVIHHTLSEYDSSLEGMNAIYKFHALTRGWGDIGYNYVIGYNGEIFEGRAGGDRVIAAHNKWNNRSSIGIAVLGDYSNKPISAEQYKSLDSLVRHLIKKNKMDVYSEANYHIECEADDCIEPLESFTLPIISAHRDARHTSCPGDELYAQMEKLRDDIIVGDLDFNRAKMFTSFGKRTTQELLDILAKVEGKIDKGGYSEQQVKRRKLKYMLLEYFKKKSEHDHEENNHHEEGIDHINEIQSSNDYIKVKLSFPHNEYINIHDGETLHEIARDGNYLVLNGKKEKAIQIKSTSRGYNEIVGWDRTPAWDKAKKYNDNIFRGDLIIYVKFGKIVVVNRLRLEDYLKGLGEVSNSENPEKIKTIIIAARTYAYWYMTEARKFEGEWYDASDDPNVFQKYLGYGLEMRSPKVNQVVAKTKGNIITYNGNIIKPWYSSSTDGKTRSYREYCEINNPSKFCEKESKKYPFLQSVVDPGSKGKTRAGHGVGISGRGITYFAKRGWSSEMIIAYFLRGVDGI